MAELLLGAGNSRVKKISWEERASWSALTTLDISPACKPDVVWDMEQIPLPFADDTFDELHAYEVLEHMGRQGDWKFFFAQFSDFWRILKPDGMFFGTSPHWSSAWAWGDPGHTRIIGAEQFSFLDQEHIAGQVGITAMTDYRECYRADFIALHLDTTEGNQHTEFVMQAVKPSRLAE